MDADVAGAAEDSTADGVDFTADGVGFTASDGTDDAGAPATGESLLAVQAVTTKTAATPHSARDRCR